MNQVIAWAGFLGAWLLVAGPLYQGAIELREEEVDREGSRHRPPASHGQTRLPRGGGYRRPSHT